MFKEPKGTLYFHLDFSIGWPPHLPFQACGAVGSLTTVSASFRSIQIR